MTVKTMMECRCEVERVRERERERGGRRGREGEGEREREGEGEGRVEGLILLFCVNVCPVMSVTSSALTFDL